MLFLNENTIYTSAVVATYWAVSISMVYLNKILMSNDVVSIPAPLFITWYQCTVTSIICWLAGLCGDRAMNQGGAYSRLTTVEIGDDAAISKPSFFAQFPRAQYHRKIAVQIFPLSIIFVGMVSFNNLCLKNVEVSFYNVARSLTIVFNVIFSWILLGIPTSRKTVLCIVVVVFGFYIGVMGEMNFSLNGTAFGVLSSLFVSLNSIFTKRVLSLVDDNHWKLTFYNNVNASLILAPMVYIFEADFVLEHIKHLQTPIYWSVMTLAGFFGFAIGIVTVLQIKATSPLSHNFSGTAKAAVQSMLAFYLWGNEATLHGVVGIFTVLGGSLLYTYAKMNENNHQAMLIKSVSDVEMPSTSSRNGER
jgi:GDP-fucose transporter C1|eukprot:scaffold4124_cov267-Chaetoceros_neogracile.AAC.11